MGVHIVSGSAGCDENLDKFNGPLGPWSAVRDMAYGYGHMNVMNATHLQWEQLNAANATVSDSIWIIKTEGHAYKTKPAASRQTAFEGFGAPTKSTPEL